MDSSKMDETCSFYDNSFKELLDRSSPPRVTLAGYFEKYQKQFGFDKIGQVLSIGPYDGEVDMGVLRHLPNCYKYTAVEPNLSALPRLGDKMKVMYPNIQYSPVNKTIEEWEGPSEQFDLIFCSYVVHHFMDRRSIIQKLLSWLKPEGKLVIILTDCDIYSQARSMLKDTSIHQLVYRYNDLRKDLDALPSANFVHEDRYKFQINVRNLQKEEINLIYDRNCNNEELDEVRKIFEQLAPSGVDELTAVIVMIENKKGF